VPGFIRAEAGPARFPRERRPHECGHYKRGRIGNPSYNGGMLCELCLCEEAYDFHHLIPRALHGNKWFKKRYGREKLRAGIHVCRQCHRTIHDLIPQEKTLGRMCPTLELLRAHPEVAKYVAWKRNRNSPTTA
jgi:hypothetical protein